MLSIREQLMRKFGTAIDDDVIDDALRYGTAEGAPEESQCQARL